MFFRAKAIHSENRYNIFQIYKFESFSKQINTYKYELTKGNKVVYVGITNNPGRREAEHRQNKNFDKMKIVGNVSTLDGASQWETNRIQTYMNNHKGQTPLYNQNEHGK